MPKNHLIAGVLLAGLLVIGFGAGTASAAPADHPRVVSQAQMASMLAAKGVAHPCDGLGQVMAYWDPTSDMIQVDVWFEVSNHHHVITYNSSGRAVISAAFIAVRLNKPFQVSGTVVTNGIEIDSAVKIKQFWLCGGYVPPSQAQRAGSTSALHGAGVTPKFMNPTVTAFANKKAA